MIIAKIAIHQLPFYIMTKYFCANITGLSSKTPSKQCILIDPHLDNHGQNTNYNTIQTLLTLPKEGFSVTII